MIYLTLVIVGVIYINIVVVEVGASGTEACTSFPEGGDSASSFRCTSHHYMVIYFWWSPLFIYNPYIGVYSTLKIGIHENVMQH